MKIETKYDIGDIVYTLSDNRIIKSEIISLSIKKDNKITTVNYLLKGNELRYFSSMGIHRSADDLFDSMEDIIKYLSQSHDNKE